MSLYEGLDNDNGTNKNMPGSSLYDLLESEEREILETKPSEDLTINDKKSSALRFQPVRSRANNKKGKSVFKEKVPAVVCAEENECSAIDREGDKLKATDTRALETGVPPSKLVYFGTPTFNQQWKEVEVADTDVLESDLLPSQSSYLLASPTFSQKWRKTEYSIWGEDYDPLKPNRYEEYAVSDEKNAEDEDWLEYLLKLRSRKEAEKDGTVRYGLDYDEERGGGDNDGQTDDGDRYEDQGEEVEELGIADTAKDDDLIASGTSTHGPNQSFAAGLLKKFGWIPGKGLGKSSNGIVKPLQFIASRKRPGSGRIVQAKPRKRSKKMPKKTE